MASRCHAISATLLCLLLAACSGIEMKPGDKARNSREIREGPGMLTGTDGEFVIFRIEEDNAAEESEGWKQFAEPEAARPEGQGPEAVE